MKKITLLGVALMLCSVMFSQDIHKKIRINNSLQSTVDVLARAGVDIRCGASITQNSITVDIPEEVLPLLDTNGIKYTVEIENVIAEYQKTIVKDLANANRQLELEKAQQATMRSSIVSEPLNSFLEYTGCDEIDWTMPANFHLGGMGGCLTVSETLTELDEMKALYGSLISTKLDASANPPAPYAGATDSNGQPEDPTITYGNSSGGTTWSGQTIHYVRITGDQSVSEGTKPQILYTSMIHSREVSSLMSNIYFMWYLLENYDTNPAIKNLVDNNELYFIPIVNPDGLRWNEAQQPSGGGTQRGNLRPGVGSGFSRGVDLNRNFDYLWGSAGDPSGSSGNPGQTYRGPYAFSEPETKILRNFVLSRSFKSALMNHSAANTVVHPYGGIPTMTSGREDEMHKWHEDMTKYNRYVYGATVFTPANGIADDWMVGGVTDGNGSVGSGQNILASTPEHGNYSSEGGFWPNPSIIDDIAKRGMRIYMTTAYYGGKYAKFHDLTQSDIQSTTSDLTFGIERLGQTDSDFTLTVTPISSNILNITSPSTETGMAKLEQKNVTAAITLDPSITPNDRIKYKVELSDGNGVVFYDADFEKYYQPTLLLNHNPDTDALSSNWTATGGWTHSTIDAYSGTTAIKDGASVPYADNRTAQLTTSATYDLSNTTEYQVQFYTQWDIERNYDYVELVGSNNGGSSWTTLCGKYTKPEATSFTSSEHVGKSGSASFQSNSSGQVYDGDQMDKWVMEEIVIDNNNNSFMLGSTNAQFRFIFRSDGGNAPESFSTTYKGFFIDDFKIIEVNPTCQTDDIPTNLLVSSITQSSAVADWNAVTLATYDVRYREIGAPSWTEITDIATNSYNITGLTAPNDYEIQVRTRCTTATSDYSASINFSTVICTGSIVDTFPYLETFNSGTSLWTQVAGDDGNWTLDANGTPTTASGPSGDFDAANPTVNGSGNYFYTEASNGDDPGPNATVYLESPCFDLTDFENSSFSFYYHMFGGDMGNLVLEISNDDGLTWNLLETITGQQQTSSGAAWLQHTEDISAYDGEVVKLRFTGNTGANFASDIAIDEINLLASPVTLSINNNQFSDITIYPNPFSTSITVKVPQELQGNSLNFELIDLSGRSVSSFKKNNIDTEIILKELSQLSAGSYFIKISSPDINKVIYKQIVKK